MHSKQNPVSTDQNEGKTADKTAENPAEPVSAEAQSAPEDQGKPEAKAQPEADKALEGLSAKIKELEAQNADLNDKYLRKAADFDNYRKRMVKEKEDARLYANSELLVDLVSLLDDFERAIQSSEQGKDFNTLNDGVKMIRDAFLSKLEGRYGLKTYAAAGDEFDPMSHEALSAEQSEDIEVAVVKDVYLKGYRLHDRVIRAAKVAVKMPAAKIAPPENGEAQGGESPSE
jgi:molecular chaperone GrpE